jgi:hypothetical protein
MIKVIKIGNLVYQGIEVKTVDENGNETWNIPNNLETLRTCTIDTLNWLIGQEVKKATGGELVKMSAANSKAIVLLIKALDSSADKSNFTDTEKAIWDTMLNLGNSGYCDSELLLNSITAIGNKIQEFSSKISNAMKATTTDELISLLEE